MVGFKATLFGHQGTFGKVFTAYAARSLQIVQRFFRTLILESVAIGLDLRLLPPAARSRFSALKYSI
jgi:hypothetical protein